jgi:YVTN family beta-propeller protein
MAVRGGAGGMTPVAGAVVGGASGIVAALLLALGTDAPAADRQPVYIGARACGACHDGPVSGNQYSIWLTTRHAQAYAALSLPEAIPMARLSGISGDPVTSPICLGCHTTAADNEPWEKDPGFDPRDGVQCEKCHGPGSEYADLEIMRDPVASRRAGLTYPTKEICRKCHYAKGSHVAVHHKPLLDIEEAWKRIAHPIPAESRGRDWPAPAAPSLAPAPAAPPAPASATAAAPTIAPPPNATPTDPLGLGLDVRYKNPLNLALRPGARELWVACESSGTVIVVDTRTRRAIAELPSGGQPTDVAFSPDGARAYVSNRLDDSVTVFDASARRAFATLPVGDEPHGLLTDPSGRTLFVANALTEDISVVDTATLVEVRRLPASRRPWSMALSPDGVRLLVTNALSRLGPFRTAPMSEATVLDVAGRRVDDRVVLPESNLLLGAAWHPSGEFALVTLNRTKNLVPMTRIAQGWTITNGLGIVWADGTADQVLLDAPNHYFADATDVAITPDGRRALVTSAGTDRVAVIDVGRLVAMLRTATPRERREVIPNHLGRSAGFVEKEIAVRASPRGVTVAPDGSVAYVANALDDSVSVLDLARLEEVARIDLGGPRVITRLRHGERLFNSASIAFQRELSCHTCHPDGHVDGLTYDIEADGIGKSPVDNRTLRGIYDTDPFKWAGTNATLARQCGPRLAVFFTRIQPFTPEELSDLNDYTVTITLPPNRHRPPGAPLTEAQRRGKAIFERTRTTDGRDIPLLGRCVTCHFPPYFTDRSQHDVGTRQALDTSGVFDVPSLNNVYDTAPYLHNGMADTLEEIWTRFNPYDTHGVTNDMTKDQLNDLIEYLKTL